MPPQDDVHFARPRALPGVELVSVAYHNRAFPMHTHAEYVIGVVTSGAEALETRGASHIVAAGDVLQLYPDQPHANRTCGDGPLRYRVFYLPTKAIRPYLEDNGLLSFDSPVVHGHRYAQIINDCHSLLSRVDCGPLEQETALMAVIRAIARSAPNARPTDANPGSAIDRARDYIDAHFADNFSLSTLAEVADLSVFHLARSFKAAVGLSPLNYRNLRRVTEARNRLLRDDTIAGIAADLGFADQSHLTRQFQNLVGISPGLYRQQLRSRRHCA